MLIDTSHGEGMLSRMKGLNLHLCHESYSSLLSAVAKRLVRAREVARIDDNLGQTGSSRSL